MIAAFQKQLLVPGSSIRVHLVGVAGSGMSGLAQLLLEMGHRVSGCDRSTTSETERLQKEGMTFYSPHVAEAIEDAEVIVYSSAIPASNPVRVRAEELGLTSLRRAECLAAILHTRKGIVVSGTHGKTTTSAMTAHLLAESGLKPCHYVGAEIPVLGRNAHWNPEAAYMVAEGDESDGTLVNYQPEHSIILNIEAEHLDHYSGLDEIKAVFQQLIDQTRDKVIYCRECPVASELLSGNSKGLSYGWSDADFTASNLTETHGRIHFDVSYQGEVIGRAELGIPGRHNVLNSLAAIATAWLQGAKFESLARGLSSFAGAKRRFESKYLTQNYQIIDDYGHHPTEIAATLQTARSLQPGRLIVLFQPHRYSRTQRLATEFGEALQAADVVYVTDVYPASEAPIPGISGETIVEAVQRTGDTKVVSVPDLETAHHAIGNKMRPGDLFLTLGAGNVHIAGTALAKALDTLEELTERCQDKVSARLYEPMRKHTTLLVGGPAQFWIEPSSFNDFKALVRFARRRSLPIRVVGRGSNLLVRDGGIPGIVIHPSGGPFSSVEFRDGHIVAGAGAKFKKVASIAQQHGLSGFGWMEGIPGSVGGGLRMNAGAMGIETFDQVVSVTSLDEDGEIRTRNREEIVSYYRNVPELQRNYALEATFKSIPSELENIDAEIDASKSKRKSSQPIAASSGCTFKNPDSIPAGKLVDELGLKGSSVGGATVSDVHGNFIINEQNATATEVITLIEKIRSEARESRGIELETEVQITGENEFLF